MQKFIIFSFLCFVITQYSIAQSGFQRMHYFEQVRAQAYCALEVDGRIFSAGLSIEKWNDPDFNPRGIYLSEFDQFGGLIDFHNIQKDSSVFFMNLHNELKLFNNKLYTFITGVGLNAERSMYEFDLNTNEFSKFKEYEQFSDNSAFVLLNMRDFEFDVVGSEIYSFTGILNDDSRVALVLIEDAGNKYEFILSQDNTQITPKAIEISDKGNVLVFSNILYEEDWIKKQMVNEFSIKGDSLNSFIIDVDTRYVSINDVLIDGAEYVLCGYVLEEKNNREFYYPIIYKTNNKGEVLWKVILSEGETSGSILSQGHRVLKSHDESGYIIAGTQALWKLSDDYSYATLNKISLDGEEQWQKTFSVISGEGMSNSFTDMEYTSDGGFIMTGILDFPTIDPWIHYDTTLAVGTPGITSILVKTDAEGNINIDTTSTLETLKYNDEVFVYPNPVKNQLFISEKESKSYNYKLFDAQGRLINSFQSTGANHTFILPMSDFESGTYFLQINDDSNLIRVEQIIKKN